MRASQRLSFVVAAIAGMGVANQGWTPASAQTPGTSPAARVATRSAAPAAPAAAVPTAAAPAAARRPFPELSAEAATQLQSVLVQWERQSQGTKTFEAKFTRWHYDPAGSPNPKQHARRSDGVIKYARPDRGLFRVDKMVHFAGMQEGQPVYRDNPGRFGEYWICTGENLIEMDRGAQECKIQDLPKELQGTGIIDTPLPFVFNLDAAKIQERYWVRQVAAPGGIVLIEAWPKRQEDLAQYKMVQIALEPRTFTPKALIMYAPNFDAKTAPVWDHYEFNDVRRNSIGNGLQAFLKNFIPEKPPASWKILRDDFLKRTAG